MTSLVYQRPSSNDKDNIENKIDNAIDKFFRYSSTFNDKKEAIRTLADHL